MTPQSLIARGNYRRQVLNFETVKRGILIESLEFYCLCCSFFNFFSHGCTHAETTTQPSVRFLLKVLLQTMTRYTSRRISVRVVILAKILTKFILNFVRSNFFLSLQEFPNHCSVCRCLHEQYKLCTIRITGQDK